MVSAEDVTGLRSQEGKKYKPCASCKNRGTDAYVYVLPYGESYHTRETALLSALMYKEFAVKTRDNSNKLYNLLDEYNLTDRIITTSTTYEEIFQEKINYESVNKEIENRRKISMNFLTKTIKQIKK